MRGTGHRLLSNYTWLTRGKRNHGAGHQNYLGATRHPEARASRSPVVNSTAEDGAGLQYGGALRARMQPGEFNEGDV